MKNPKREYSSTYEESISIGMNLMMQERRFALYVASLSLSRRCKIMDKDCRMMLQIKKKREKNERKKGQLDRITLIFCDRCSARDTF